jgi:CubicO group peptidase (beta-lactamase class C family)
MLPQTRFEIASITKTFTATTLILLLMTSAPQIDILTILSTQTLQQTAPKLLTSLHAPPHWYNATLQQLMQHTSAIDDYWKNPSFVQAFEKDTQKYWGPLEILRDYAAKMPPLKKKTTGSYSYSDTNYMLLGLAIEEMTGKPLQDVFREKIFSSLSMNDTYFPFVETAPPPPSPPSSSASSVLSHRYEGQEDLSGVPRQSADWAGGGLVSSTHDLSTFLLQGLVEGKVFTQQGQGVDILHSVMLHSPAPTEDEGVYICLGLFLIPLSKEDDGIQGKIIGHDGWGKSFMYFYKRDEEGGGGKGGGGKKTGLAITGTVNQQDERAEPWEAVMQAVREVMGVVKEGKEGNDAGKDRWDADE